MTDPSRATVALIDAGVVGVLPATPVFFVVPGRVWVGPCES